MKQLQTSEPLPADRIQNNFLDNLYRVIEDNLDVSLLNVEFPANSMAMSRSTLNRKLSLLTGKSANELGKTIQT